jgi:DNA-binding transcriptional regulator YhcF (GntR family)
MLAIKKRKVMAQSKHRDIFDQLKADILGGKYGDGKPLPSAFALMKKFGVARGTVDRAMTALEHEGLIEKRKGSGTYPVKREPITFGVIVPEADRPFYSRVCTGIANFANSSGGGGNYSLLCSNTPLKTAEQLREFAKMCADSHVAGVFFARVRNGRLNREVLSLFRAAKIPVVLLGGESPSLDLPCDLVGMNYLAHGRRIRVNFSSPTARRDFNLLSHGELFGDVAVRLMLQRLSYGPKHPPAEVFLDLPKPKPIVKGTGK